MVHHPFHASPELSELTGPILTTPGEVAPTMPPLLPRFPENTVLRVVDAEELAGFFDCNNNDINYSKETNNVTKIGDLSSNNTVMLVGVVLLLPIMHTHGCPTLTTVIR